MRLGKRERAANRQRREFALGNAMRFHRAMGHTGLCRMRSSTDKLNYRLIVGRPSFKWGWDFRKAASVRMLNK